MPEWFTFGGFLLVHLSTPLGVCDERVYVRADADLTIETIQHSPQQAAQVIRDELGRRGYLDAVRVNGNSNGNGLS